MSSGKYYIQNEYIYGPKMSGKFYIRNDYIYGPKNSGKYYIQNGYIYGPKMSGLFHIQDNYIYGPDEELPWLEGLEPYTIDITLLGAAAPTALADARANSWRLAMSEGMGTYLFKRKSGL